MMGDCILPPPTKEVHDVEEGEISDSASSIEEITEDDFKKQQDNPNSKSTASSDPNPVSVRSNSDNSSNNHTINNAANGGNNSSTNNSTNPSYWMSDFYNKYRVSRSFNSGLHNLAWASGVQNKPITDFLVMEMPETNKGGGAAGTQGFNNNKNEERVVIEVVDDDGEKEEGELEEGEIDLDSEAADSNSNAFVDKDSVLDKNLESILKGLEGVNLEYAEKSFVEVCGKVQHLLDNLKEIAVDDWLIKKDDLIQLSLAAIRTFNTVFCSMNQNQKEQNKESIKRLLDDLLNKKHPLFSSEQLKEMESMISSLDSFSVPLSSKGNDGIKEMQPIEGFAKNVIDMSSGNVSRDLLKSSTALDPIKASEDVLMSLEYLTNRGANSKYRGLSLPLLDLHKDHDADSLPSPTREATPCLPIDKGFGIGHGVLKPEWPIPRLALRTDKVPVYPYETEAVKAVSTYRQKFGRGSFLMNDRLPSPTPSEDGENGDDIIGEVSSSPKRPVKAEIMSMVGQPVVSSSPNLDNLSVQGPKSAWKAASSGSGPNPLSKQSFSKSRDPRLRLANADASAWKEPLGGSVSSKKQKTDGEQILDGPALKRSKTELAGPGFMHVARVPSGTGGWLEDRVPLDFKTAARKPEQGIVDPRMRENVSNGTISNITMPNVSVVTPSSTGSVQSILTELVVNPSILLNFLKGQQMSSDPTKSTSQPASSNSILGAVPSTNISIPKPPVVGQGSSGILQTPPQTASMEESVKVRMKPRDPRRVLHSNDLQTSESMEIDQLQPKTTTLSIPAVVGNLNDQRQDHQRDKISTRLPTTSGPDISLQFKENLKSIADILTVSQASSSQAIPAQFPPSQPAQSPQVTIDAKGVLESGALQTRSGLVSKEVSAASSRSQNKWGDVEHLFDGFDDQQKAAIQRERARRLDEQRKMFAARKLCLVLDLDHTLLNSAKACLFAEVDLVHDEILRKKEEQDREKQYKHLFRFPHMSMWTKLRPGVWNFLEKASKLFELHLYTMGNKLYATEMAKLLDPKGELFAGRVISRGDDGDLIDGGKSKDLEGVLGMESAVVIIDDSVRVWPHNKLNLIVVERYIYFPCSRRQFGLPGPSLLEIDHDERPEDGTLASSLAVIEKIHRNFFEHQSLDQADVRNILASEQQKILAGCRILFSRVFPVGEANPHMHPLWQTAEQFGAVCTNAIDDQVTHVVANSLGTDKVNWALSKGRFVVHPGWVEASALLYRRANEHDFAIKP